MREFEIIHHRQIEGLSMFFDTVEYRTPHFHPEWELILITNGTLQIRCEGRELIGSEGDLFLFYPGQVHEFQQLGQNATFLCLQISPQIFGGTVSALGKTVLEDSHMNPYLCREQSVAAKNSLYQMFSDYLERPPYYELNCISLCASLLYLLLTSAPCHTMSEEERSHTLERNARLERFIRFVDENYMRKIRLSDFAESENCSTSYLSRFIKAAMNQTFQEYVNSVRYHSACKLIAAGERKMLDVCEEAGFSDYRYFSAAFKRQCGMTPEEYSKTIFRVQEEPARHSLHSHERFYSREESRVLLNQLRSMDS